MQKKKNILILASTSKRRTDLLKQIGIIPNITYDPNCNEKPQKREIPHKYAHRIANQKGEKALQFFRENPPKNHAPTTAHYFILAADTVVAAGRRIIPKPQNQTDAMTALQLLSGKRHRVHTSLCLITTPNLHDKDQIIKRSKTITTIVSMKRLSQTEIQAYIKTNEWKGKAGAYAIQGHADAFVKQINGSYSNVVGLPLYQTNNMLKGCGYQT